ncbi:MAG: HD domain-containing protein [Paludibacteraceae bacterium]|nr:HD domain-containing protein [Paludibacteraceae bacterium]MDY6379468.1 HD domain-containing protein [Bacteroidales bacterium]
MIITDKKIENPMLKMVGAEADRLGLECYVIGGYVRDLFLHRESTDIDVVVVGSGISLAEAVAKKLGKGAHLSVFKTYGTAQVKRGDLELEFVGARKESYTRDSRNPIVEDGTLQEDQDRRDFTINAMAICLNSSRYGELLDPFDGIGDLERCIIRTPLNPDITFSDDPLRMMRAIRFATQLGFNLHPDTFDAIRRNASRLEIITRERIAEELNKIMMSRRPSEGWLLLDKTGLLPLVLPELVALKGVEVKDGKGHKDVFLHTLKVLDNLADSSDKLWLRWAALLHDIGKPRSKAWDPQAGWTFRNHNYIGAKMVPRIFAKLKLPLNEKMEYVKKMVDLHMRPINLIEDTVTDSAVRRLLFEAGDDIDDLMLLCDADITSRNEEKKARFHRNYQLVRQKMVELEERDRIRNFQPPVKGDEIMEILHLEPCSIVGELKAAIKDAILDGIIPNEYEPAKEYMLKLAHEKGLC